MNELIVYYVWNEKLIIECDRLPAVVGRASMVHNLIYSYGLLSKLKVVRSRPASYEDLRGFHSELFLDHLKTFKEVDEDYMSNALDEEYGLGYDCPPVSNMFELVSTIAGGSVTGANSLVLGVADVAINWCGGWHHAQRFGAEGFCYVNDIVLAIEKLRQKFTKVLYIDLDVHHGNGIQDAYNLSKSVFTLSLHKYEPGFYPGTGGIYDIGRLDGKGYACNFPFNTGYSDQMFEHVFGEIFSSVYNAFEPNAIVVQCGADALAQDPNGGGNLTAKSYCTCVKTVLDKRKPTLLLGGGGYKHTNVARLWSSITALVVSTELDEDIPDHSHWMKYGPDYILSVTPTLARDTNKRDYINKCIAKIKSNLEKYLYQHEEPSTKHIKADNTKQSGNASADKQLFRRKMVRIQDAETKPKVNKDIYEFDD